MALRGGRKAPEDGGGERAQPGVVVTQRELVQRPLPVGAAGGVGAQQEQGVPAAVAGEVAQHGQREAGAVLVGVEQVAGVEQMPFDPLQSALQLGVEARVVQGARLDLPVAAWVADHAALQCRQGLGPRRREGVQRPVAAASLQEATESTAGRYVGIGVEHEVSIRCGGLRWQRDFRRRLPGILTGGRPRHAWRTS